MKPRKRLSTTGFTLLELIMVMAVLAIASGFIVMGAQPMLQAQQSRSGFNAIRQIIWQGATAAASRDITLNLVRSSNRLQVQTTGSPATVIRYVDLPSDISSQLRSGTWMSFTPSGKVNFAPGFTNPFNVTVRGRSYTLTVSLIGEVRVQ